MTLVNFGIISNCRLKNGFVYVQVQTLFMNQMGSILQITFRSNSCTRFFSFQKTFQKLPTPWSKYSTSFFSVLKPFYPHCFVKQLTNLFYSTGFSSGFAFFMCSGQNQSHATLLLQKASAQRWHFPIFLPITSWTVQFPLASSISCPLHLCVLLSVFLSRNEAQKGFSAIRPTVLII